MNVKSMGASLVSVCWIVLTAGAADVNWKTAANGDFNVDTNWEGDAVPQTGENAVIDKTGADYTVTLSSSPSMSSNLIVIGNSGVNTTKVEIVGSGTDVTLDETFFRIKKNGLLRIADGAHVKVNAITADGGITPSSSRRYIFDGVDNTHSGDFILDNATMDIDYKKSYCLARYHNGGLIALTNGAVMTFHDRNASKVTEHVTGWESADISISDTSKIVIDNPLLGGGSMGFGNLVMSDNAQVIASNKWYSFTSPNYKEYVGGKWVYHRTAHVVIKDNACLSVGAKGDSSFIIEDSGNNGSDGNGASSIVFDFCTAWRGFSFGNIKNISLLVWGLLVGRNANDATMNLSNAYVFNRGNGTNIGCPTSARTSRGTLNILDGGCIYYYGSGIYPAHLYSLAVGTSEWATLANKPFAYGTLNVYDGGAITNKPSTSAVRSGCYFHVGASRADGTINQYGGTIAHFSRLQTIVGVRGGTGRYNVMGGLSHIESDVYVGGIPYERMQSVIEGMDHINGDGNNFALKYDYLNKGATGTVHVTGGTFQTVSNLYVSVYGKGTIEMGGDTNALLVAKDIVLSSTVNDGETYTSDVKFTVGKAGTGLLKANGKLTIGTGAKLSVTVTETPETAWTPLVAYDQVEGDFAATEVVGRGEVVKRTRKGVNAYWLHVPRGLCVIFL